MRCVLLDEEHGFSCVFYDNVSGMRRVLIGAALIACAVGACATNEPGGKVTVDTAGETTAVIVTQGLTGMEAEVIGSITSLPSGCLGVTHLDTTKTYPVAWPDGTRISRNGEGVILPNGVALTEGTAIRGTGGFLPGDAEEFTSLPDGCQGEEIAVLSSVSRQD